MGGNKVFEEVFVCFWEKFLGIIFTFSVIGVLTGADVVSAAEIEASAPGAFRILEAVVIEGFLSAVLKVAGFASCI